MPIAARDNGSPGLSEYLRKRDFSTTPEPGGKQPGRADSGLPRFVVQEHHARSLHWDFRIESAGVLRSWAVPKGPPLEPGVKRLAVAVEDHPLDYIDFAGVIPPGNYGAGEVLIWDQGTYEMLEETDAALRLRLAGGRLAGVYQLVHTRSNQWLMWRRDDG